MWLKIRQQYVDEQYMNNQIRKKGVHPPTLRRYTNLAAVIHHLQTKTITLLDPDYWQDRNDAHFIKEYKNKRNAKTVLALCFAEQLERSHHWQVFAAGIDGVCIQFDKNPLLETLDEADGFKHGAMDYASMKNFSENPRELEKLPFVKRIPYKDEREYRIIYVDESETMETKPIDIEISWIKRVTLSPWIPKDLARSTRDVLKSIDGCGSLKIYRSTLFESEKWKNLA